MAHRWWMVIFGSMSALWLVVVGPAWALPTHEYDMGWGRGGLNDKHDHEKHDYEYGHAGDDEKHDKYGKLSSHDKKDYENGHRNDHKFAFLDSRWDDVDKGRWGKLKKHKDYDGHGFKKWGQGKDDSDCDPPVSTPEPGTLLLLGSTLTGFGVYARRRRQPAGGTSHAPSE